MSQRQIIRSCTIKDHQVKVDDRLVFEEDSALSFKDFSKVIYKKTGHKYPKFFKMDALSKLGYICAELLLQEQNLLEKYASEDIAVVLTCRNSSLHTDHDYQDSIDNYPSPGLFVYTLPNIMIGEICIRHKFKGENACFVSETFDSKQQLQYLDNLLDTAAAKVCIAGQIDFLAGAYFANLFIYK